MAGCDFKPGSVIAKTNSEPQSEIIENREPLRKTSGSRLHGKRTDAAPFTPAPRPRTPAPPAWSSIPAWSVTTCRSAASG